MMSSIDMWTTVWTTVPSYSQFIESSLKFISQNYVWLKNNYNFPMDTISDLNTCRRRIPANDLLLVLFLAIVWTAFRYAATEYLFKPFARLCRMTKKDEEKFPESTWNFFFYLSTFSIILYITLSQTNYFVRTDLIWKDFSMNDEIPQNIRILYLIEMSFYFHSMYAVLFLDEWRKDSLVMFSHHIITLSLLVLSLATKVGVLVLLLHDGCDVIMAATKCLLTFKTSGLLGKLIDGLTAIGFLSFMSSWAICRLYWFPLKAIYSCSQYFGQNSIKFPFMLVLYSMLWVILLMDIYWFSFIVKIVLNIITGQKREIEDNREYNEYSPKSVKNGKKQKKFTNGLNKKVE